MASLWLHYAAAFAPGCRYIDLSLYRAGSIYTDYVQRVVYFDIEGCNVHGLRKWLTSLFERTSVAWPIGRKGWC